MLGPSFPAPPLKPEVLTGLSHLPQSHAFSCSLLTPGLVSTAPLLLPFWVSSNPVLHTVARVAFPTETLLTSLPPPTPPPSLLKTFHESLLFQIYKCPASICLHHHPRPGPHLPTSRLQSQQPLPHPLAYNSSNESNAFSLMASLHT